MIFTSTDSYYVTGFDLSGENPVPLTDDLDPVTGAANDRAVIEAEGDIFYLTPNLKIRRISQASQQEGLASTNLSDPIDDFMQTLDRDKCITQAHGDYDEKNKLVKWYLVEKNSDYPNKRLIYDLKKNEWLAPDTGVQMGAAGSHKGVAYIGSATSGQVYVDENGRADAGVANIPFRYFSKEYDLNNPQYRKEFRQVRLYGRIRRDTEMTVQVLINGQDSGVGEITVNNDDIADVSLGSIGTATVGFEEIGAPPASDTLFPFRKVIPILSRGYSIQIIVRNTQTASQLELSHWSFLYTVLDPDASTAIDLKL